LENNQVFEAGLVLQRLASLTKNKAIDTLRPLGKLKLVREDGSSFIGETKSIVIGEYGTPTILTIIVTTQVPS